MASRTRSEYRLRLAVPRAAIQDDDRPPALVQPALVQTERADETGLPAEGDGYLPIPTAGADSTPPHDEDDRDPGVPADQTLRPDEGIKDWVARAVRADDREPLAALLLDAYHGTIDDEGEGPAEALAAVDEHFSHMLWEHCLVLEQAGEPASLAFVVMVGGRHYIDPVVTAPAAKCRGLGRAAVRASLESLTAAGVAEVGAVITDGNTPSERLFASLGFTRVGPWPPEPASTLSAVDRP